MRRILALLVGLLALLLTPTVSAKVPEAVPEAPAQIDPVTLFNYTTVTFGTDYHHLSGEEVGVKFKASFNGYVTSILYYKFCVLVDGVCPREETGKLWSGTGQLLGSVVFPEGTPNGWQTAVFPTPIPVTANTLYVASYDSHGMWHGTVGFFDFEHVSNYLLAPASAAVGGNGVYGYHHQFPTDTYSGQNYWVDVVFQATGAPSTEQCVAPTLVSHSDTDTGGAGIVNFEWSSVDGVSSYVVQRTDPESGYINRGITTGTGAGGTDAADDPSWRVFANAGFCETPGKALIFDP